MKARYAVFCILMGAGIFFAKPFNAPAQGTAFTYQGLLNDAGSPANGSYDLQFTLYNAASNGNSVGVPVTIGAAAVTNGLFTVPLDFGGGVFDGRPLWLQIGVRTNGAQTNFIALSPLQALTAAPYAVTAANLSGVLPVSQLSGAIAVANVAGVQAANVNLATNLTYTNFLGIGQVFLPVTIGHTYIYYPTLVNGTNNGACILGIVGANCTDWDWFSVDPSGVGSLPPYQTNQIFVATQNTVTFVNIFSASGPVTDSLFDLANQTINGTINGVGQFVGQLNGTGQFNGTVNGTGDFNGNLSGVFSGTVTNSAISGTITNSTFTGIVTNSTLAGNAQGGAVTNLDAAIANLRDYGQNLAAAFQVVTNAGGVIYNPIGFPIGGVSSGSNLTFNSQFSGVTGINIWDSPIHIVGNGPALSVLTFWGSGAGSNFFDSSTAPFGFPGIDFSGIRLLNLASVPGTGNNNGYVSAPGGYGTLYWANDQIDQFSIGACLSQSGMELDAFSANYNTIGLVLPYISDGAIVHDIRSFDNTGAGIELDSRGNQIYYSGASDNIGILVGRGGGDFIQTLSENDTNCVVAFGYPPNWPFTGIQNDYTQQYAGNQNGNAVYIGPVMAGFGYAYPGPLGTTASGFPDPAYVKVWDPPSALDLESETLADMPAYVSYVPAGDSVPVTFHHVTVGGMTNLAVFSDGTSIPASDGTNVGLNEPDLEFTKNVLKYSRDTNGNLFAAGDITTGGVLNASAAQVGVLNVSATTASSLLGTDAGNNVTGISLGSGLALSGSTLSVTPSSGSQSGHNINIYTSSHTATAQDGTMLINGFGVVITLPDAAVAGAGTSYVIKMITNSTTTIVPTGSQHIDNLTFYTLIAQNQYVAVQSDGNQWWIVGNN